MTVLALLSAFVPKVSAIQIDQIGQGAPGISEMWNRITALFPFARTGAALPGNFITGVASVVGGLIAFVAVALIAYAGARATFAGFSEESVSKAKSTVKNVVIGLIAALVGDVLVWAVASLIAAIANAH